MTRREWAKRLDVSLKTRLLSFYGLLKRVLWRCKDRTGQHVQHHCDFQVGGSLFELPLAPRLLEDRDAQLLAAGAALEARLDASAGLKTLREGLLIDNKALRGCAATSAEPRRHVDGRPLALI